jgi:hypothetical protein
MGSWFLHNSQFLLILVKTQKKYQPKSASKIFFLFHRNVKKTKKIFLTTVLSFFYGLHPFDQRVLQRFKTSNPKMKTCISSGIKGRNKRQQLRVMN